MMTPSILEYGDSKKVNMHHVHSDFPLIFLGNRRFSVLLLVILKQNGIAMCMNSAFRHAGSVVMMQVHRVPEKSSRKHICRDRALDPWLCWSFMEHFTAGIAPSSLTLHILVP
jgi:hypothetical protein